MTDELDLLERALVGVLKGRQPKYIFGRKNPRGAQPAQQGKPMTGGGKEWKTTPGGSSQEEVPGGESPSGLGQQKEHPLARVVVAPLREVLRDGGMSHDEVAAVVREMREGFRETGKLTIPPKAATRALKTVSPKEWEAIESTLRTEFARRVRTKPVAKAMSLELEEALEAGDMEAIQAMLAAGQVTEQEVAAAAAELGIEMDPAELSGEAGLPGEEMPPGQEAAPGVAPEEQAAGIPLKPEPLVAPAERPRNGLFWLSRVQEPEALLDLWNVPDAEYEDLLARAKKRREQLVEIGYLDPDEYALMPVDEDDENTAPPEGSSEEDEDSEDEEPEESADSEKEAAEKPVKKRSRRPFVPEKARYIVTKSREEARYTLGPFYIPDRMDAHGEWTGSEDLQKGIWNYVRKGNRDIYLQHTKRKAGEWVELMSWPFESEVALVLPGMEKASRVESLPAGTAYIGVIWEPWAWEEVKAGRIRGMSMGGFASRVDVEFAKHAQHDQESHGNRLGDLGAAVATAGLALLSRPTGDSLQGLFDEPDEREPLDERLAAKTLDRELRTAGFAREGEGSYRNPFGERVGVKQGPGRLVATQYAPDGHTVLSESFKKLEEFRSSQILERLRIEREILGEMGMPMLVKAYRRIFGKHATHNQLDHGNPGTGEGDGGREYEVSLHLNGKGKKETGALVRYKVRAPSASEAARVAQTRAAKEHNQARPPTILSSQEVEGAEKTKKPGVSGEGAADYVVRTGDVEEAVRALAAGKKVELTQKRTVSTLLDKLAAMAQEAKAKGDKAPKFNLCDVSVKGTNLFCVQSKGIPRVKMPQLSGIPKPGSPADKLPRDDDGTVNLGDAFMDHLESKGFAVKHDVLPADVLRASQDELDGAKVAGMTQAMETGKLDPEARSIWVTSDDYIIDGHHWWAAAVGAGYEPGAKDRYRVGVRVVDTDILTALDEANKFTKEMGLPSLDLGEFSVDEPVKKEVSLVDSLIREVESLLKHGTHNQETHGNWAHTGGLFPGSDRITGFESNTMGDLTPGLAAEVLAMDQTTPPTYAEAKAYSDSHKAQVPPDIQAAADKAAVKLVARAEKVDATVTPTVTALVEKLGGAREGEAYAVKGAGSTARKIADDMRRFGLTVEQAAARVGDSLRYTAVFPRATFARDAMALRDALEASPDFERVTSKPFFKSGQAYVGHNTTWRDKRSGLIFEMQSHTADTFFLKEAANHAYYEAARVTDNSPEGMTMAAAAATKMSKFMGLVPIPKGVRSIPEYDDRKKQG